MGSYNNQGAPRQSNMGGGMRQNNHGYQKDNGGYSIKPYQNGPNNYSKPYHGYPNDQTQPRAGSGHIKNYGGQAPYSQQS